MAEGNARSIDRPDRSWMHIATHLWCIGTIDMEICPHWHKAGEQKFRTVSRKLPGMGQTHKASGEAARHFAFERISILIVMFAHAFARLSSLP